MGQCPASPRQKWSPARRTGPRQIPDSLGEVRSGGSPCVEPTKKRSRVFGRAGKRQASHLATKSAVLCALPVFVLALRPIVATLLLKVAISGPDRGNARRIPGILGTHGRSEAGQLNIHVRSGGYGVRDRRFVSVSTTLEFGCQRFRFTGFSHLAISRSLFLAPHLSLSLSNYLYLCRA